MEKAIALSLEKMRADEGGPFGAVITRDNVIIATGHNQVTSHNDPTAHAEIVAIRNACQKLGTFDLAGCELYTSCEPCPMCLSAIYWARIKKIYFGNTRADAAKIGFDDDFIYREIPLPLHQRKIPMEQMMRDESLASFAEWQKKTDKIRY